MSPFRICLLPGDGIGPEVINQARMVLESLPVEWDFTQAEIGFGAYQKSGSPLPAETLVAIRSADAALFGAVTTPPNIPNYFSPVVRMRQDLDLYANLRPCRSFSHPVSQDGVDLVVVRENTEGLYSGIERIEENGERAVTERVITRKSSERIVSTAFELARRTNRSKVTIVHKANVLRQTCGLFRQVALEVAARFPEINAEEMLIDTCAMELIRAAGQFEVIVTTNLFGDILSDEAAMLVGGLGMAYSGNLGADCAVFEPVHGSAPKLAGTHRANPAAAILAAAMMLEHLGESQQARRVRQAVDLCLEAGETTEDLGGILSTGEMTQAILSRL